MAALVSVPSGSCAFLRRTEKGAAIPRQKDQFLHRDAFLDLSQVFLVTGSSTYMKRRRTLPPRKRPFLSPVMEWQDCSSVIEADVPCSVAYKCYSNRELIPNWMPFISSVKVLKDKPDLSRWSLKYEVFGQDVEFSWLARNMQPIPNQKIHWRSLEGLPNRGAVRFYPKGASSCRIEVRMTYSFLNSLAQMQAAAISKATLFLPIFFYLGCSSLFPMRFLRF
ncbi:hypothetical protein AXF42_Ash001678 [Apostasia shenzhenica]|uniref:Coenzyme Q-binding protein COQ10 START domain-containing protein n=1 Tax=Apostasia shenzhenica TaxID=1088818 RepID=A0A2I0AAX1_9ASPA|nr:hypothetical protein AXF42_Ash001678 [Apostasia shenzhenica]